MWRGDPDYGVGGGGTGAIVLIALLIGAFVAYSVFMNIRERNYAEAFKILPLGLAMVGVYAWIALYA